jgi:gliding motility-associated-like protein
VKVLTGLASNPLEGPSEYVNYTTSSIPLVFDSLARGDYYVFVQSESSECSIGQGPYTIDGVYPVDFTITPSCTGNDLSFSINNIIGNPDASLEARIYKRFTNEMVGLVTIDPFPATGSFFFDKAQNDFLKVPDEYLIQLAQFDALGACFEMTSELKEFDVPYPLEAAVSEIKESYPDVATGQMTIDRFAGGTMPYYVRIELDSAASFGFPAYETDFTEAEINIHQQLSKHYENLPGGRYQVQIDIFIPNIMTPNGDGINDVFYIRNLPEAGYNKLVITNRWGKEVYSTDNYKNNWEGKDAADGVYYYRLDVNGNSNLTGWIEIMRGQKP